MAFDDFKKLSFNLEQNIKTLEHRVSDASNIVFYCEEISNSEGMKILENLSEQLSALCEKLDEAIKEDEADITEMTQQLDASKMFLNEFEDKANNLERLLIQRNLLELETQDQPEDVQREVSDCEDDRKVSKASSIPRLKPITPVGTPFRIARVAETARRSPELTRYNEIDLQNTMCDFETLKIPSKQDRKTFVVRK